MKILYGIGDAKRGCAVPQKSVWQPASPPRHNSNFNCTWGSRPRLTSMRCAA